MQRKQLEGLVRNGHSSQKVALRCCLLLLAVQGVSNLGDGSTHWSVRTFARHLGDFTTIVHRVITERMIRHGTFHNASELERAIFQWLYKWNSAPTLFVWKAAAEVILDKVRR